MALRTEVHTDPEAVARRAAAWITGMARQAIGQRDRCVLALSGGTTPLPMLRVLATTPIDWRKVEVIQVDERVVPSASPDRNLAQLRAALLARIPLPESQIHPMPVEEIDLGWAAQDYGRLLVSLAGAPPRLDLVVLGLGADGHTASLVPGDAALDIRDADVAVTGLYQGRRRMTLTFPVINRARHILWLVTGADKAEMLARLIQGDPALPASRVRRASALLLADRAAATRLAP
jgi:6-phosphogluconolactonase